MLFGQACGQVLAGTKTEIRKPVKSGEVLTKDRKRVRAGSRTKWKVGNTYAVQPGGGKKAVGRILLHEIEEGLLGRMGPNDVEAEGFTCLEDFVDAWESTHGRYDPNQPIWILRFEREPTPEEKAARKRIAQEDQLWRMANEQFNKLSAVGHELGEWRQDGDLQLKNTCSRCEGSVTVSVGKINMVAYIPLMHAEACLADYPEQMEAAQKEWRSRLTKAVELVLSEEWGRARREAEPKADETT